MGPDTGCFQIPVETVWPRRATSFVLPTFTDSSPAVRGAPSHGIFAGEATLAVMAVAPR